MEGSMTATVARDADERERYLVRYLGSFAPVTIRRAEGTWIETTDGRRILDFASGQICSTLGHRHPRIVEAVEEVLGEVMHLDSKMLSEPVLVLAELLANALPDPLEKVILLNTGAEANEFALKLAKTHSGKFEVVAVDRSFHGVVSGIASYTFLRARAGFGPLLPGAMAVPAPYAYRCPIRHCEDRCDLTCLEVGFEQVDHQSVGSLCSFIVEPVLSSGGIIVPPDGYLRRARELCDERDMTLILDESQTGLGRLGKTFGLEHEGVVPDMVALSKTLGGGMPLAATVTTAEIEADCVAKGLSHNTSHVADPLPAAAGIAVMQVVEEEGLATAAEARGAYLMAGLRELARRYEVIGDVRGQGLLLGVELVKDRETREPAEGMAARVGAECLRRGLSMHAIPTGPKAHCFRIAPPLTVSEEEIDLALSIFDEALEAIVEADASPKGAG
jgi:2,2-dialkylglycine decarboxylase (pyruvate)